MRVHALTVAVLLIGMAACGGEEAPDETIPSIDGGWTLRTVVSQSSFLDAGSVLQVRLEVRQDGQALSGTFVSARGGADNGGTLQGRIDADGTFSLDLNQVTPCTGVFLAVGELLNNGLLGGNYQGSDCAGSVSAIFDGLRID